MQPTDQQTGNPVYRRPESVLIVVYTTVQPQRFLLLKRCSPVGFWQSVTGTLEWGETAADCARRELQEETGLQLKPLDTGIINRFEIMPEWRARYSPEVSENTEYVFSLALDQVFEPVLSPQEHLRFDWLSAESAKQRCFSHTNIEAIERIVLSA